MFENEGVDFNCPNCGHEITKTIGWLTSHKDMTCPGCGVTINLNTDELSGGIKQIEDALEGIPKDITIKL